VQGSNEDYGGGVGGVGGGGDDYVDDNTL